MNSNKFRYILIIIFSILLFIELFGYDYNCGFQWKKTFGFISPTLMIIAMVVSINHVNKEQKTTHNND